MAVTTKVSYSQILSNSFGAPTERAVVRGESAGTPAPPRSASCPKDEQIKLTNLKSSDAQLEVHSAFTPDSDPRIAFGFSSLLIECIDSDNMLNRLHLQMMGHYPSLQTFDKWKRYGFTNGTIKAALKWAVRKGHTQEDGVVRFLISNHKDLLIKEMVRTQKVPHEYHACSHPLTSSTTHYHLDGSVIIGHKLSDIEEDLEKLRIEMGEEWCLDSSRYRRMGRRIYDYLVPAKVDGKPFAIAACHVFCRFWRLAFEGHFDPETYWEIFDENTREADRAGLVRQEYETAKANIEFINERFGYNFVNHKSLPDIFKMRVLKKGDYLKKDYDENGEEIPWGTHKDIYGDHEVVIQKPDVPYEKSDLIIEEFEESSSFVASEVCEEVGSGIVDEFSVEYDDCVEPMEVEESHTFEQADVFTPIIHTSEMVKNESRVDKITALFDAFSVARESTLQDYGEVFYKRIESHPRAGKIVGMLLHQGLGFCKELYNNEVLFNEYVSDAQSLLLARKRPVLLDDPAILQVGPKAQWCPSVQSLFDRYSDKKSSQEVEALFEKADLNPIVPTVLCPHKVTKYYHCICGECDRPAVPLQQPRFRPKMPRFNRTQSSTRYFYKRDACVPGRKYIKVDGVFGPVRVHVSSPFKKDLTVCGDVESNPGPDTEAATPETITKEGNVTMVEESLITADSAHVGKAISAPDPHHDLAESPWDIKELLSRKIEIGSFPWKVNATEDIATFVLPAEIFKKTTNPTISQLRLWSFLRCGVKLSIEMNGTNFHCGRLIAYWQPPIKSSDKDYYPLNSTVNFNYVYLDANLTNAVELSVPFTSIYSSFPLRNGRLRNRDRLTLGLFRVRVFNVLRAADGASQVLYLRVFMTLINPEVRHTTYTIDNFFTNDGYIQAGPEEEGFLKRWTGKLLGAGLKGVLGSLAGGVATGAASFITGLIFDKPTDPMPPERFVNYSVPPLCHGASLSDSVRLSLSPISLSSHNEAVLGGHPGEYDIKQLVQIPTRLETFQWKTADTPGSCLFKMMVTPTWIGANFVNKGNYTEYSPSMLAYVSRMFYQWRGSIHVTFQFVTTTFHCGNVMVAVDFQNVSGFDTSWDHQFCHSVGFFQIKQHKEFTIEVPYASSRAWLRCDNFRSVQNVAAATGFGDTYLAECAVANVYLFVSNALAAPPNVSQTIDVNVFIRGGPDFTLATPCPLSPLNITENSILNVQSPCLYSFVPVESAYDDDATYVNAANYRMLESLYREGYILFKAGRVRYKQGAKNWDDLERVQFGDQEVAMFMYKLAEIGLYTYQNEPRAPWQFSFMNQMVRYDQIVEEVVEEKKEDSTIRGYAQMEVDLTTREAGGPATVLTHGTWHTAPVADTIGEHSMNIQTLLRRDFPLLLDFMHFSAVGFSRIVIPVTPSFMVSPVQPIKDQFNMPVPVQHLAWTSRLFTFWRGGLRYRITFGSTDCDTYVYYNPKQVSTFHVERGVREVDIQSQMVQAGVTSFPTLQSNVSVACPFHSDFDQLYIDPHIGLSESDGLHIQNGCLNIAWRSRGKSWLEDPVVVNVFISTDEDFIMSILKAAPKVFSPMERFGGDSSSDNPNRNACISEVEFMKDLDDGGRKFTTTYNTGYNGLRSKFRTGYINIQWPLKDCPKSSAQMFCPSSVKRMVKKVEDEKVVESLASVMAKTDAVLSSLQTKIDSVTAPCVQRDVIKRYVHVSAQIVTAGSVLYCIRNCVERPSVGAFISLGTSFAALIGLAVSESIQQLIYNACDWVSNIVSIFKPKEALPKVQSSVDALESLIAPYEEEILGGVAVIGTIFYAYIFDVLPSWKEIKGKIRSFFESEEVSVQKKSKAQALDLKAAHFSVLGITALNKVYEKILDLVQRFLNWLLKRDDPKKIAQQAHESLSDDLVRLLSEIEDLDFEQTKIQALQNPLLANRYYEAWQVAERCTQEAISLKCPPAVVQLCTELRRRAHQLRKELEDQNVSYPKRFTPFWIQLSGDSQVGKTHLCHELKKDIMDEFHLSPYNVMFSKNPSDKYWSGYSGQPIVLWDDMYQSRDADEAVGAMYQLVGDQDAAVNMAAAEEKGRRFRSIAFLSTTNAPFFDVNTVVDNDARRNRVRVHLEMKFKEGYDVETVRDLPHDDPIKRNYEYCNFRILTSVFPRGANGPAVIRENCPLGCIRDYIKEKLRAHYASEMQQLIEFYGDEATAILPRGIVVAPPEMVHPVEEQAAARANLAPALEQMGFVCRDGHYVNAAQGLRDKFFMMCPHCSLDDFEQWCARKFLEDQGVKAPDVMAQAAVNYWRYLTRWQQIKTLGKIAFTWLKEKVSSFLNSAKNFIVNNPRFVSAMSVCSVLVATVGAILAATHRSDQNSEGAYDVTSKMHARIKTIEGTYESGPTKPGKIRVVEGNSYDVGPKSVHKIAVVQGNVDNVAMDIIPRVHRAIYIVSWAAGSTRKGLMRCLLVGGTIILLPYHFFNHAKEGDSFVICDHINGTVVHFDEKNLYRPEDKDWCLYNVGPRLAPGKKMVKYFVKTSNLGSVTSLDGVLLSVDTELAKTVSYGKVKACRSFLYADFSFGDTYKQKGWEFSFPTKDGQCGSPLMGLAAQLESPGKILGIHTAGIADKNWGFSVLVTQESLIDAINHLDPNYLSIIQPPNLIQEGSYGLEAIKTARIIPQGRYTYHCIMPSKYCPSQPVKTTFIQTPWFEEISKVAQAPKIPAKLVPFDLNGVRISPLAIALSKYGQETLDFPHRDVQKARDYVSHVFSTVLVSQTSKTVWSEHDAIVGIPGVPYAERLNMKSSPGLPYQCLKRTPGKWDLFDEDSNVVPNSLLRHRLDEREALAKEGEMMTSIWRDCLKDELRPREKAEQGKTRLFTIAPVDFTILLRRYTMDFVLAFYSANVSFFSAVGINPESFEWTRMYQELTRVGKNTIAGDFKTFDGKLLAQLMMLVCDLINDWYGDSVENQRVRRILFYELIHTIQQVENLVYQTHQGNPSGNPLTVIINTIIGHLYFILAFLQICKGVTLDTFSRKVVSMHYGDDNVTTVHPDLKAFNFNSVKDYLNHFGIEYTLDTKKEQKEYADFQNLDDVTFLKRGFRQDPDFGYSFVVPTMSLETLDAFFYYYRKAIDVESQLQENMRASLAFAAFHGKIYYKAYLEKWLRLMHQHGFRSIFVSFEEQVDIFLQTSCNLGQPVSSVSKALVKYSTEGMESFMKFTNSKPARIFGGCLQAPLYYLLAAVPSTQEDKIERSDDRWAAAIPSGEGKSYLCKLYPKIFVDHDELLLPHFSPKSFMSGKNPWSHSFAQDKDFPRDDRRILLVHHPNDTKRQMIGSFVTHRPSFIRLNALQRLRLHKPFHMSREDRNEYLVEFARNHEPQLFAT